LPLSPPRERGAHDREISGHDGERAGHDGERGGHDAAKRVVTMRRNGRSPSREIRSHVKDDEKIDAAELLSSIREGTEEANKERVEKGFKAMHVEGWIDPPVYDQSQHHLVWALSASSDEFKSVNFNTRILGRSGYVSINLVTTPELLAGFKPEGAAVLHATHFNPGARYEDFNAKTDKVAEYGLAGLVLGGAGLGAMKLVKIGLLAKFWKVIVGVLIAGKKAVIAAIIAIVAVIKRLFGRKKANDSVAGG